MYVPPSALVTPKLINVYPVYEDALPVDTVKSVVQTQHLSPSTSSWDAAVQLWAEGGVRRLFRGWPVAFTRGVSRFTYA
jgi:hypothetical protein